MTNSLASGFAPYRCHGGLSWTLSCGNRFDNTRHSMLAFSRAGRLTRFSHHLVLPCSRRSVSVWRTRTGPSNVLETIQLRRRSNTLHAFERSIRTYCFLPCDEIKGSSSEPSQNRDSLVSADETGTITAAPTQNCNADSVVKNSTKYSENILHDAQLPQVTKEKLDIERYLEAFQQPACPGCGAFLQSEESRRPGYIPPSKRSAEEDHRVPICQRCFNLKHYNQASDVALDQSDVAEFLSPIQRRKGLIVYVVDVMNLPGSLFSELLEVVGEAKRIVIVGNKVDMLPVDGRHGKQQQRLKEVILQQCESHGLQNGNIKGVCLISAKTGFGLPELINQIQEHWDQKGDVYLVGCVNSGKTTLFNLFLDLFNAHKKGDMLNRGTVSLWPGTTLSLLRFPLGHWMLVKLRKRFHQGVMTKNDIEIGMNAEIIDKELTDYKDRWPANSRTSTAVSCSTGEQTKSRELAMYEPEFVTLKQERRQLWCYDTPGFVGDQQITNFLTVDELKLLNPTLWIVPRTLILKPGQTLLLGGLGRVDYMEIQRQSLTGEEADVIPEANKSIYFTVIASPNLPVHVSNVSRADEVYEKHAGTEILMIPSGGKDRMAIFPKLKSRDFTVTGKGWKESAADVILSNIGWIAVTAGAGSKVTLRAYTPSGLGLDLREPALLPTSVTQRGKRGAKRLGQPNLAAYESSRRRSPQLMRFFGKGHAGVYQWVSQAKKKRKEQNYLAKTEKMKRVLENSLGSSDVTNPLKIRGAVPEIETSSKQSERP